MTIAFERRHFYIIEILKSHRPYHYQLPGSNGRHGPSVAHHIQLAQQQQEMVLRQQQQMASQQGYAFPHPPTSHHEMMVEMQSMPPALEHYSRPDMQLPPREQTFGDLGYPVSSTIDLGLPPGSVSYRKQMSTPHFFSNTMAHMTENGGMLLPPHPSHSTLPPPPPNSHRALPSTSLRPLPVTTTSTLPLLQLSCLNRPPRLISPTPSHRTQPSPPGYPTPTPPLTPPIPPRPVTLWLPARPATQSRGW